MKKSSIIVTGTLAPESCPSTREEHVAGCRACVLYEMPVLAYYEHFPCELFCVIQVFLVGMASVH